MNITKFKNKKILIKTYLFESGLFYLGKSLYHELIKNNEVFLFPKESSIKDKTWNKTATSGFNIVER